MVTLRAVNSADISATASVTVIVEDDLDLPGNILTAGPTQVGWQVNPGSTQLQIANISIGNAGSGSLSWTASENAGWLTLSATSGTIAAGGNAFTLTLTANPAGLSPKKSYSTQLILTKPSGGGVPTQTITIPVTLTVGSLHDVPPPKLVFMPLLRR